MELKFTLKDSKEKQTLLYAVCYYQSKRIKVSTGLKVFSETWNAKMQRCEISSRFTERINRASRKSNRLLDSIIGEWEKVAGGLDSIIDSWKVRNEKLNAFVDKLTANKIGAIPQMQSANDVKEQGNGKSGSIRIHPKLDSKENLIKEKVVAVIHKVIKADEKEEEKKQITPLDFFDKYVEEMTHKVDPRTGRYIGERTQVHHRTVLKRIMEKPSAFDPRGQSDIDPRKLFYFDPSKVLTGGVIFILPCLLLGLHLADAFAKEFDAV